MFNITRTGFAIRLAEPHDSKALRMLLPVLRNGGAYFVAVDRQSQLVVGAGGFTASCRTEPVVGPGVALEVIEPCRRQGIATTLLLHLERAAEHAFRAVRCMLPSESSWEPTRRKVGNGWHSNRPK